MNEKFFALPREKQDRMRNAACKLFAQHGYKHAPMQAIADAGGISKGLLFHYFRNKQELYLYLWEWAAAETGRVLREHRTTETADFFEMLRRSLAAKCALMRSYPWLYSFAIRAYYEGDPAVREDVQASFGRMDRQAEQLVLDRVDQTRLRPGTDLRLLYREALWAADGCLRSLERAGTLDPDRMEREFSDLIDQWEWAYCV